MLPKLFAIIAVAYENGKTLYVKRSAKMQNYPGVWSLPSIQFDPQELPDPSDLFHVERLIEKMSAERFGGIPIKLEEYLTTGDSDANPIGRHVFLHLYRVTLRNVPKLHPDCYTDMRWMTAEEFEAASKDQTCGLCTRLWADYAWLEGITDRPFNRT